MVPHGGPCVHGLSSFAVPACAPSSTGQVEEKQISPSSLGGGTWCSPLSPIVDPRDRLVRGVVILCVRVDFTHLYLSLPRALSLSLSLSLSDACARALSLTLKKNSVGRVLLAARRLCPRGVRVGVWRTGRLSVFQRCRVGYAWTLGLVRRLVALSGLLLRWLSRAFGSY
jgi:hypothetical protein